jgi:S-formylglutathione hydrolase
MDSQLHNSFKETQGKTITCKAAVAWEAKKPLDYTDIQVSPPKKGEVRLKVFANALCHTDIYTLDGHDPEGLFPCILGHEASGVVESVGEGVTSVVPGDIVIPAYTPECREYSCIFCQNENTNLCPKIRAFQGKGVMPDGTSRFSKDGKTIFHFMGCSTFSEYTVVAEISCAKINPAADVNKVCILGCGVSTGWGAAVNNCKVTPGSTCVVFGLGAVGLAVIQSCKDQGASTIVGVDLLSSKFQNAKDLGATYCVNPSELNGETIKDHLLAIEKWGYNFTFDCTGNVKVMRDALEIAHRGFGESCVIGVAASGHEIATRPFQLVTGRNWKGTAFGGWKSRTEIPKLVNRVLIGELPINKFITHDFHGLDKVNDCIHELHKGECLRGIVHINENTIKSNFSDYNISMKEKIRSHNGFVYRMKHWSKVNNCNMNFSIYLPDLKSRRAENPPVLYYLSGLTCSDENALVKSDFTRFASKNGIAVVFPDTSPRDVNVKGASDSWDFGFGAGFYVDATEKDFKENFNMYSYVTKELPEIINAYFPVNGNKISITGHSMGGHGAIICHLKNPGMYKSVSAFSPICNPSNCDWGKKAFLGYLGNVENGKNWDATELMRNYKGVETKILIDQGTKDKFLRDQLKPEAFLNVSQERNYPVELRYQANYDHSYFFISTFIEDHIEFHTRYLQN